MRRSIKLLLIILYDSIKDKTEIPSGLCHEVKELSRDKIISPKEKLTLDNYIQANRPKRGQKHFKYSHEQKAWYWPSGEIKPRLAWLETHIKKQKDCK